MDPVSVENGNGWQNQNDFKGFRRHSHLWIPQHTAPFVIKCVTRRHNGSLDTECSRQVFVYDTS